MLCGGNACQQFRTDGQRRGGAEGNYCPPPFFALHRLCPLAIRPRAGRALPLWLLFVLEKYSAVAGLVNAFDSWQRCV